MTGDEALAMLVSSAGELAGWYRNGGNPETDRYMWLMDELAIAVDVYRQHHDTDIYQEKGKA
jgi:hypothetical protein